MSFFLMCDWSELKKKMYSKMYPNTAAVLLNVTLVIYLLFFLLTQRVNIRKVNVDKIQYTNDQISF